MDWVWRNVFISLSYTFHLNAPFLSLHSPLPRPLFSEASAYGGDGRLCQELQKPNGFPHPTRQDQTSPLTSVTTGYYFTELTNFRWGAAIKWSVMETCSCLPMPQVFNHHSSHKKKKNPKHCNSFIWGGYLIQVGGAHFSSIFSVPWLLKHTWARNPTSTTDAVQKLIPTPAVPVVSHKGKVCKLCLLGFEYVPGGSVLSIWSFLNASWKYRFKVNVWFPRLKSTQ